MKRKKILVLPSNDASLLEFIKLFEKSKLLEPIFYLDYPSSQKSRLMENSWIIEGKLKESETKSSGLRKNAKKNIKKILDNTFIGVFVQTKLVKAKMAKKLAEKIKFKSKILENLISTYGIDTCLISTDRSIGIEASLSYLSKRREIKLLVCSFAYSADFNSIYKLRATKIYKYPKYLVSENIHYNEHLGNRLFFRPFEEKALSDLNIFPKNPWVLGSGFSDLMLVDSEKEKNRLISLGGDPDRYIVTGVISHDSIFNSKYIENNLKKRIKKRYFKSDKPLMILALPQYYEHGLCEKEAHFYILNELLKSLDSKYWNILISLHPKMDEKDYYFIQEHYDVSLTQEDLSDFISSADIFLATFSSTVAWALICHIPTIIFDFIGLGYEDFFKGYSIPVVDNINDLGFEIERVINLDCPINFDKACELSPFDGKCLDRIERSIIE